eukprot:jgi/Chrzof1/12544/UNPLg00495.t1
MALKVPALPGGKVGLAIQLAIGVLTALWWTSGPGADEASDIKAKENKRNQYSRHFAFKGRGRKEHLRFDLKNDRTELQPTRGAVAS